MSILISIVYPPGSFQVKILRSKFSTSLISDLKFHLFLQELGMPLSTIPINYQTAAELTRLCLKKVDNEDNVSTQSDDADELGREETELVSVITLK